MDVSFFCFFLHDCVSVALSFQITVSLQIFVFYIFVDIHFIFYGIEISIEQVQESVHVGRKLP